MVKKKNGNGGITDHTQIVDSIQVSLEKVPTDPIFPCPKCDSETKQHGEAPRETSGERICSSAICRKVQPEIEQTLKEINGRIVRFPCRVCGCETKIHKDGRIDVVKARICSNKSCKYIVR